MKELEYLSESLWDYCLDVYLSVCKRISLDDHFLIGDFNVKVGQKVGISSYDGYPNFNFNFKKQVKNY